MSECLNCSADMGVDVETHLCRKCEHMNEPRSEFFELSGVDESMDEDDDYKPLYSDADDDVESSVDDVGDRHLKAKPPKVWEPLPPGAGVNFESAPRFRTEPPPSAEVLRMREYIASLPKSAKGLRALQ